MKKYIQILLMIVFIVCLCSCSDGFTIIKENSNVKVQKNYINIMIKDDTYIYEAKELAKKLEPIYEKIVNVFPDSNLVFVELSEESDSNIYLSKEIIHISTDEDEDKITKKLIASSLSITEPWIIEGIYGYLFMDWDFLEVEIEIMGYFKGKPLSLFGGRFYETFNNNEEDIKMHKKLSALLIKEFMINGVVHKLGKQNLSWDEISYALKVFNLPTDYMKDSYFLLSGFTYDSSDIYLLTLDSVDVLYCFTVVPEVFTSIEEFERFIIQNKTGIEKVNQFVKKNAPEYYNNEMLSILKTKYFINKRLDKTEMNRELGGGNIVLLDDSLFIYHIHEYCHNLFRTSPQSNSWLVEGTNEYISNVVLENDYFSRVYKSLVEFKKENSEYDFLELALAQFESKGGILKEDVLPDLQNRRLLTHAIAYGSLYTSDNSGRLNITVSNNNAKEYYGYNLSYEQAQSFVAYLIDKYGFETVATAIANPNSSFEKVFGTSYEEEEDNWLKYIEH